jgi:hypothetical protein
MQQSPGIDKAKGEDFDQHIKNIMEEIELAKSKAASKYKAIKYDPVKPKTCTFKTPIMEDLYPKVELAE